MPVLAMSQEEIYVPDGHDFWNTSHVEDAIRSDENFSGAAILWKPADISRYNYWFEVTHHVLFPQNR
jgi:hypothetical protein